MIPPGNLLFQPVAIGATVEETKLSKPSMERAAWRPRELAGRNVSERWTNLRSVPILEKGNVRADLQKRQGRPTS